MAYLIQVVLQGHGERDVAVQASSAVRRHRFHIATYNTIKLDKRFSSQFSDNLG